LVDSGWVAFRDPEVGRKLCDDLLKGNAVNEVQATPSEERESFEDAFGRTVTPWDALRKGPGKVYFGISSLANERRHPLTETMNIFGKKKKKELKEEGWQTCVLCHAINSDFWDRPYKFGWMEHLMQERFRESKYLELMWSREGGWLCRWDGAGVKDGRARGYSGIVMGAKESECSLGCRPSSSQPKETQQFVGKVSGVCRTD
jgi:hypothetical protein